MAGSPVLVVVIVVAATAIATLLLSARLTRDLFGGTTRAALGHLLSIFFRRVRGYQIIDGGETVFPHGDGPFLGPRLVIVRPGNAVSMVQGGQITRVQGPGIFRSRPYEFVNRIHDLRERQTSYTFEDALSRDVIEMTTRVTVSFALDATESARQGLSPLTADEQEMLRRMTMGMPQWENAVRSALEQALRYAIGAHTLDSLISHAHLRSLEQRIIHLTNDRISPWGVRINALIIECLRPKSEITAAAANLWVATNNVDVEVAKSTGFREALTIIAAAYRTASDLGMPEDGIRGEIRRRTLEQWAKDPAAKLVFTHEPDGGDHPEVRRSLDVSVT